MKYNRIYNFSSGPSVLPVEVLEECQKDLLNYKGSGVSVMEMSHRSDMFLEIMNEAQELFRQALNIPKNYKILFMQGGAYLQFATIPMNLSKKGKADYVLTGQFSSLAAKEAAKFTKVQIAASTKETNFDHIPAQSELKLDPEADYVHICFNNTVYGTKYPYIPVTGNVPLVADMSSCILSEPVDVSKFAMIYAGAQKNIAPAGVTMVIIREDLLAEPPISTPTLLTYKLLGEADSRINTPPCWSIYVMKLVMEHLLSIGGVKEMQKRNIEKANTLYNFLDSSKLFKSTVQLGSRSIMNITFRTGNNELDTLFLKEAKAKGMINLKGHPAVGGLRASLYNSMPAEGVEALVNFMAEFEKENK